MSIEYIGKILDLHGVPYMVTGGRVLADSMIGGTAIFERTEDVTNWSIARLHAWLGY